MKKGVHPKYVEARVICSCGETFVTRSTQSTLRVEICSKCHPFFTGKQKFVDSGGRVERFQKKYGMSSKKKPTESAKEEKAPEEASEGVSQEPQSEDESTEKRTTLEDEAKQNSPEKPADTPEEEEQKSSSKKSSQPESKGAGST